MGSSKKAKKKNRCSSLLKMLKDFCGYTSFGGLGRVVGTKVIVFKVLWVLIFVAALGWATYQLILLFGKYQSRPISTKISLRYNATLAFPSVVLCNFNMIRKSKIAELPRQARDVLNTYISDKPISKQDLPDIHENPILKKAFKKTSLDEDEDEDEYDPDLLDKMYKKEEKLSVVMAGIDELLELEPFGHQFESMIRSCTFKGVNCRNFTKYWSQLWHYKYGNCFTFNPYINFNGKQVKGAMASKPGPLYGLTIEMDIQQEEYIDQLTQNAGAVVLISVRGKMPFPYEEGLSLAPGFSTSMGVRLLQINREDPFKNQSCVKTDSFETKNIYKKPYNVSYSKTACEQSCLARHQHDECSCMEYRFPVGEKIHICDILNKTTALCLQKVARKAKHNQLGCSSKCRPLCSDQVFQISTSFSSWPSAKYQKHLAKELEDEKRNQSSFGGISNNQLKFHVFFQELNYQVIDESIAYQLENFLSDVGGQLGLWLGVSVLSGVEVVELLALMMIFLYKNRRNSVKMDDPIAMEEGERDKNKNARNTVLVNHQNLPHILGE